MFWKADLESKNKLFQTILNTPAPSDTLITPFSSKLFINPIVSTISLLIQILGLDSNIMVYEVMLGIHLYLSQYEAGIKFDEFLAREINYHLGNFDLDNHFRYQVYLFSIIVNSNQQTLEDMNPEVFKDWPRFV